MAYKYEERMETSLEIDLEEELEKLKKLIKMKENEILLIQISIEIDYAAHFNPFGELEIKKAQLKELKREYEELLDILI